MTINKIIEIDCQGVTPHSFPAHLKQESGYCTRSCPPGLHAQVGRLPRDPERVVCYSILRLKICGGNKRTFHLFPFRLRLLILSFRGTLEALQGIIYAGSECVRAKCFEEPKIGR